MATTNVVGLFDQPRQAVNLVNRLLDLGMDSSHFNVIVASANAGYDLERQIEDEKSATGTETGDGAAVGAGAGAVLGGLSGLLAGIAAFAIPGIGTVLALGPFVAALTGAGIGAAAGSLIGALTAWGIPDRDAHLYAEGVRRGGILVIVHSDHARLPAVTEAMEEEGAVDLKQRAVHFYNTGWTAFDNGNEAQAFNEEEIRRDREQFLEWMNELFGDQARPSRMDKSISVYARANIDASGGADLEPERAHPSASKKRPSGRSRELPGEADEATHELAVDLIVSRLEGRRTVTYPGAELGALPVAPDQHSNH